MTKTLQEKIDEMNYDLSYANMTANQKIWIDLQINEAVQELREAVKLMRQSDGRIPVKLVLSLIGEKK